MTPAARQRRTLSPSFAPATLNLRTRLLWQIRRENHHFHIAAVPNLNRHLQHVVRQNPQLDPSCDLSSRVTMLSHREFQGPSGSPSSDNASQIPRPYSPKHSSQRRKKLVLVHLPTSDIQGPQPVFPKHFHILRCLLRHPRVMVALYPRVNDAIGALTEKHHLPIRPTRDYSLGGSHGTARYQSSKGNTAFTDKEAHTIAMDMVTVLASWDLPVIKNVYRRCQRFICRRRFLPVLSHASSIIEDHSLPYHPCRPSDRRPALSATPISRLEA